MINSVIAVSFFVGFAECRCRSRDLFGNGCFRFWAVQVRRLMGWRLIAIRRDLGRVDEVSYAPCDGDGSDGSGVDRVCSYGLWGGPSCVVQDG